MKKFFIALSCTIVSFASALAQEATTIINKYEDKPIHGIMVNGAFDVQIRQASGENKNGAKVEIEKELADKLVFEYTEQGYVRLGFKDDMSKYFTRSKKKPQAWIVVTDLRYVSVTGASNVVATSVFTSPENVRIMSSGAASINLMDVTAKTAQIQAGGTSKMDDLTIKTSEKTVIDMTGTSKINGKLNAQSATIKLDGVCSLSMSGSCDSAKIDVSGTSSASLETLVIGNLTASVTGVSRVKANISGSGIATVGATSFFRYTGPGAMTGKGVKRLD